MSIPHTPEIELLIFEGRAGIVGFGLVARQDGWSRSFCEEVARQVASIDTNPAVGSAIAVDGWGVTFRLESGASCRFRASSETVAQIARIVHEWDEDHGAYVIVPYKDEVTTTFRVVPTYFREQLPGKMVAVAAS